jgi:hypothetical protein
MRTFLTTSRLTLAAGAALFVAGCSGSESATNAANDLGSNAVLEEPANDASALESAANATEPLPVDNVTNTVEEPQTSGGDTGGNTLQSNDVAGM